MSRVHIVRGAKDGKGKRPFDPSRDVPACAAIKAIGGAALVIIDPIVMVVAKDSHKNAETRRELQPIVDMAAELKAALLGVTHFTKGTEGRAPIDRVTGSLAFGALARVVWVAAQRQDDDEGKPLHRHYGCVGFSGGGQPAVFAGCPVTKDIPEPAPQVGGFDDDLARKRLAGVNLRSYI
jgi:putative DNA primase/helicase